MYMRGKLFFAGLSAALMILLTGCTRVIESPSDELRMYSWYAEFDNGNTASLSFEDEKAFFSAENEDFSLNLSGLSVMTDDRIIICDDNSRMNYTFGYELYGDRVELSCNGSTITLDKNN